FRNGVGMRAYDVSRISAELLRSQRGASPAAAALSAARRLVHRAMQTALVAGRRTDIHRRLGVAGAILAAVVFVFGLAVSVETLRRNGGPPGSDPRKFFAIPLGDIIVFGVLVGAAILQRHQRDAHKRLMLLATISFLTAAVGRFLRQLAIGGQ